MSDLVPTHSLATSSLEESISQQFYDWEHRGRGWNLFDEAVDLEPVLVPLHLFDLSTPVPIIDDGRQESFFGKLFGNDYSQRLQSQVSAARQQNLSNYREYLEYARAPQYCSYSHYDFLEYRLIFPKDFEVSRSVAENLLLSFAYSAAPVSFEVIGTEREIVIQLAVSESDSKSALQQVKSHLPGCVILETEQHLIDAWTCAEDESLVVDFGLSNEFFLPLNSLRSETDILATLTGALSNLDHGETGVFQVLFQKTKQTWAEEILNMLYVFEDTGFFENIPGIDQLTKAKIDHAMFACVLRLAAKSDHSERSMQIVKSMASALIPMAHASSNEFIPLSNDGYPNRDHEHSLLDRQTYRTGMILNSDELVSLVHPPTRKVVSQKLIRESVHTKPAPSIALNNEFVLGSNVHQGTTEEVSLSSQIRTRHVHLIGSSGSGKSTLLLGLIKQDLERGQGLCVIDPHGDLIEDVIGNVPGNRLQDVILFDPADSSFPVGFNMLKANSELEKNLLSSDMVATFRRMSTSWGDVMDSVLANAILAFVESRRGGTLFELRRFLIEKDFRDKFLETVDDPSIHYFWKQEFPHLGTKPQASILIRLDSFLRNKLIRNIVCQKETKLNFRQIMDDKKVLLIKLSQGLIGEENAYLLGTLLVSRLYQTALSRQDSSDRPYFWLYLDEFQHFITPSMESILSGVRKYNLGLHLSHQEYRQMQSRSPEVASSVLSNCYTRICFRLGDADSERFASGFSFFDSKALQNLGVGEAIVRIERSEFDFNLAVERVPKVDEQTAKQRRQVILQNTRENFAKAREEVEAEMIAENFSASKSAESEHGRSKTSGEKEDKGTQETVREKRGAADRVTEPIPETSKEESTHRYLQNILKRIGEDKGFVVTLEQQVFGGIGRVDVVLESKSLRIACEIANTNTAQYETQNIQKCIAAGFDKIVVVSSDKKHLSRMRTSAEGVISDGLLSRVHFLEPDHFHLFLEKLHNEAADPKDEKVKGYTVNISYRDTSKTDQEIREKAIAEILKNAVERTMK
mgnify:CR=1 FL=1